MKNQKPRKLSVPCWLQRSPQSATLNLCCEKKLWFGFSIFVTSQQQIQHSSSTCGSVCRPTSDEVKTISICLSFWISSSEMVLARTSKSGQQKHAGAFSPYRLRTQFWRSNVWFLAFRLCHSTCPSLLR